MARGLRSSTRLVANLSTLGRQSVRLASHDPSDSANAGRSRRKCSVSTNFGVSPLIFERGLIRSAGSSWLPQLSHWSPRAGVVSADRAGALDVAVRQGAPGGRADRAHGGLRHHVAVAVQRQEQLLHHLVVGVRGGAGEQVVGQPEALQVLHDHPVVLVGELPRGQPLGVGLHLDRGAVLVGAADHQHLVADHPAVPGEDVGGHTETGDVADVPRAVGVGPGHGGQHAGTHGDQRRTCPAASCSRAARPVHGITHSTQAHPDCVPSVMFRRSAGRLRARHRTRVVVQRLKARRPLPRGCAAAHPRSGGGARGPVVAAGSARTRSVWRVAAQP